MLNLNRRTGQWTIVQVPDVPPIWIRVRRISEDVVELAFDAPDAVKIDCSEKIAFLPHRRVAAVDPNNLPTKFRPPAPTPAG